MEPLRLRNEFVIPGRKFEGQEEMLLPQTRRQDSTRFDPFTLSFIVRQWVCKYLISWKSKNEWIESPISNLNNAGTIELRNLVKARIFYLKIFRCKTIPSPVPISNLSILSSIVMQNLIKKLTFFGTFLCNFYTVYSGFVC